MTGSKGGSSSNAALDRAAAGRRLDGRDLMALYEAPQSELLAIAHAVRLERTPPEIVTYSVGGNIDYTNVCEVACRFCAFYRARHQYAAFTLSVDEIARQMSEIRRIGGHDVLIQGGVNPELPFDWYLRLVRLLKSEYPEIHIDALSPEEVLGLERLTGRDAVDLLSELKEAGLDGMPGAAAEILVDRIRQRVAPTRIKTADWFRIVDAAQRHGLFIAWVSMVTGFGETIADRVQHLLALRRQQERGLERYGSGFAAFKVWPARLGPTRLNGTVKEPDPEQIARDYLREVAIARLALDNLPNHRAVWRTMGFGVAAQALRGGANDLCGTGSINAINATMTASGTPLPDANRTLLVQVERCIRAAGFAPALRDARYRILSREPLAESQSF